jgi:hypothetical protein
VILKKWTLQEITEKVEYDGLGNTIHYDLDSSDIEDEKLSRLWDECKEKLNAIEKILKQSE